MAEAAMEPAAVVSWRFFFGALRLAYRTAERFLICFIFDFSPLRILAVCADWM
jgi:hypothetical protein